MMIVSMREGDGDALEFEMAPGAVQRRADFVDGFGDLGAVVIAVAEDEMSVRGKETHGVRVLDVATMEDRVDAARGHDFEGGDDAGGATVRVRDDRDAHDCLNVNCPEGAATI